MKKSIFAVATAFALACLLALGSTAMAAKPETPGETTAGNQLSYPAILFGVTAGETPALFPVPEGVKGTDFSYGCNVPEWNEYFHYPNTSCVDDLDEPTSYMDPDDCLTYCIGKCNSLTEEQQASLPEGFSCDESSIVVSRMYWQKLEANQWNAGQVTLDSSQAATVRYVDWGDSIEVKSWPETSILRVETQPFIDLSNLDQDDMIDTNGSPILDLEGIEMWHVSGQGITEQWGARATVNGPVPFVYDSPYAIINAGTAELYLSKLHQTDADDGLEEGQHGCPYVVAGDENGQIDYPTDYPFVRSWAPGVGWSSSCNLTPVDYTVELSVSGKYVHGYNWRMNRLQNPLPSDECGDNTWQKTGWWRLTFVPNGGEERVFFPSVGEVVTSAPTLPEATPLDLSAITLAEDEPTEGEVETTLYSPVVDKDHNLTYIDICITKKATGGGGGGGGGKPDGVGGGGKPDRVSKSGGGGKPDFGGGANGGGSSGGRGK